MNKRRVDLIVGPLIVCLPYGESSGSPVPPRWVGPPVHLVDLVEHGRRGRIVVATSMLFSYRNILESGLIALMLRTTCSMVVSERHCPSRPRWRAGDQFELGELRLVGGVLVVVRAAVVDAGEARERR